MKQYIYGKNPIMEALKGASVYKIYMLNGHKDPKIFDICKRNQIPLEFVDKKEFDKIKKAAGKIKKDSEILIVIGIGGSYLGARAVIEALNSTFYNLQSDRKTPLILYVGKLLQVS